MAKFKSYFSLLLMILCLGSMSSCFQNLKPDSLEFSVKSEGASSVPVNSVAIANFINNSNICDAAQIVPLASSSYRVSCSRCHGVNGLGLGINPEVVVNENEELFNNKVRLGGERMPSFDNESYSDQSLSEDYKFFFQRAYCNQQDPVPPLVTVISASVIAIEGNRVTSNPITVQGSCQVGLAVNLVLNIGSETLHNLNINCHDVGVENIGQYSQTLNLTEFDNYNLQVTQINTYNQIQTANANFIYTSVGASCSIPTKFIAFKQALETGHCYDCHGDDLGQMYGDYRQFDGCEEDWINSSINGVSFVNPGLINQSRIYQKLHGSGVSIDGERMPPYRSNQITEAQYLAVVNELLSPTSNIRFAITDWVESLDDAEIQSIDLTFPNNLIVATANKNNRETQYIRFELLDNSGVVLDTTNVTSSPYQAVFIPLVNGDYSIRASAIEFTYNPNTPLLGISSVFTQPFTVGFLGNGSGGEPPLNEIVNGVAVEYYGDLTYTNNLPVNSLSVVSTINQLFTAPNEMIHPEYPSIIDNFSIVYSGYLTVPVTGQYTFNISVDDNINFILDGQTIIEHTTGGNNIFISPPVELESGQYYPYSLSYQETIFDGEISLSWTGPMIAQEIIPAINLFYSPTLINAGISILTPLENTEFIDVIPSISGSCIGGRQVIISGAILTPQVQICDEVTNTYNFLNTTLSNDDGIKALDIRQMMSSINLEVSRNVIKDSTPPNLTFTGSPIAESDIYNGTMINGDCEAGTIVSLSGGVQPQTTICNNRYSFIIDTVQATGALTIDVSQSDPIGNISNITRNFNIIAGRNLATAPVEVQSFETNCSPSTPDTSGIQPVQTLKKSQYINTLNDLFNFTFNTGMMADIASTLQLVDDPVPLHTLTSIMMYKRSVNNYSQQTITAFESIAYKIVNYIFDDSNNSTEFVGSCYNSPNNSCVTSFINNFGKMAHRRPLTAAETAKYLLLFNEETTTQFGFKAIVYGFLQSPYFLYRLENEGVENGDYAELTDYEIITRLSYLYLDSMPDAYLFAQADAAGSLSAGNVSQIIDFIFSNNSYRQKLIDTLWEFYSEWLDISYNKSFPLTARSATIAQGLYTDMEEGISVRDAMVDELKNLLTHYYDNDGSLDDLLSSDKVFTNDVRLASRYNVSLYSGTIDSSHASSDRFGILTTPAYLSSSIDYVNSFKRGAHLHKYVFCGSFTSTTTAAPMPPTFDRNALQTNRQLFESLVPLGTSCLDCHTSINSMGFAFEGYNYLGDFKHNGIEPIIDDGGVEIGQLPVHTMTSPTIGTNNYTVTGATDLISKGLSSQNAQACFTKQYFRFFNGRLDEINDSCSLKNIYEKTLTAPLKDIFKEAGKNPAFLRKKFN